MELGWLVDTSQLLLGPYSVTTLTRVWDGQGVGSDNSSFVLLILIHGSSADQATYTATSNMEVILQFKILSRVSETFADKQGSASSWKYWQMLLSLDTCNPGLQKRFKGENRCRQPPPTLGRASLSVC